MLRKFYIASLSIIVLALVALISCSKQEPDNPPTPTPPQTVAVESVSLSKSSAQMKVGESLTLTATVSPSNATDKKVSWSSSNSTVASVTEGTVKALKAGNATITARTNSGGKTATCELTIQIDTVYVTDVVLSNKSTQMAEGDTLKLSATVLPDNATNKNLTWSSSNTSVATVTNGLVTAIHAGKTNIIATSEDGGKKDSCAVTVIAKESFVRVEGVNLYVSTTTLRVGETTAYTAEIVPPEATNKNVTWHSSNNSVATIDATGTITAVAPGSTEISVTTEDGGFTASNYFTVVEKDSAIPVQWFEFKNYKTDFYTGEVYTYEVVAHPENATNKSAVWSSSNTSIATIDNNGTLTAIAPGNADITIASADGSCSSVITITVQQKIPVTGITLGYTQKYMGVGELIYLFPQIEPEDATIQTIKWSSSNPDVATIHENGEVTAHSIGEAVITATTVDGGHTASCTINVIIPVNWIELTNCPYEMIEGETATATVIIHPENATNKNLIWTSSNTSVATVENGTITAISPGEADINVTPEEQNGASSTFTVKVIKKVPVTGITLTESHRDLHIGEVAYLFAQITPEDASNKNIKWSSSNPDIATVNDSGEVTAIAIGKAEITATTEDGGFKAVCTIDVIEYAVSSISLDNWYLEMQAGETAKLTATVYPENAANKNITWSTDNKDIATVDQNGTVTAVSHGYCNITATAEDGGHTANCGINVMFVPVTGVSFDNTTAEVFAGSSIKLTPKITPENASDKQAHWYTSNDWIATVENGVVKGVNPGEVIIDVYTNDGWFKASCTVTVKPVAVTGISLSQTSANLTQGDEFTLVATITPTGATNKNVIWSSSSDAATVTNGVVKAVRAGEVTITAKTEDGGYTAECKLYIKAQNGVDVGEWGEGGNNEGTAQ